MASTAAKPGKKRAHATASLTVRNAATGRVVDADRLVLRRGGKAVGVVISMDELRYFEDLEDRLDVRDAEKALAEPARISYEEVRRKLSR